jgi:hypothetical protein
MEFLRFLENSDLLIEELNYTDCIEGFFKEDIMSFWDRMQKVIGQGIEVSKVALDKAKDKAKELGEKGMLSFEIMQLERLMENKITELGTMTYDLLVEQGKTGLSRETAEFKSIIAEIQGIEKKITDKEEALKKIK